MNKHKMKLALALLVAPLLLSSTMTSAVASQSYHKHYRHHCCYYRCCSCYCTKNMALSARVVNRLRADISTADQPIMVTSRGHTVTLSGRVLDNQQKYIAVQITRYTCGVRLVVDELYTAQP